jgi:hypothetical protein
VRTAISTNAFYATLESKGLLTPMSDLIGVFESLLGTDNRSGLVFECGPNGPKVREEPEHLDEETKILCDLLFERAKPLQTM